MLAIVHWYKQTSQWKLIWPSILAAWCTLFWLCLGFVVRVGTDLFLGTQGIHFGQKTNEITKFFILDKKRNSQFWTKFGQKMTNRSRKKIAKFFHVRWHYHNAFTVGWNNGCLELLGCEWIDFLSQNEWMRQTAGTTSWHQLSGACLCSSCNMLVAQYRISVTGRWVYDDRFYGLVNRSNR